MRHIIEEFSAEQGDGSDVAHDALVVVDIGGSHRTYRGSLSVDQFDVVSLWQTVYLLPGHHVLQIASGHSSHGFTVPASATDIGHAETPIHFPLARVALIEWAVSDTREND